MKKTWILLFVICFTSYSYAKTTLVTDQDYFPTLLKELNSAQSTINLLAFSFAVDDGKGQILKTSPAFQIAYKLIELKKAKGENIQIRLYIEGERNTVERNKITGDFLEKAGIIVKYASTHAKGFSIDHKKTLFGSTNLTTQSMMKNNETNILSDEISIANGFDKFFENLWKDEKIGSINLGIPMLADGIYKETILNAINSAKKSLEFSIYYFNDADIENAFIKAFSRGVQIRGYFNSKEIPGSNLVEKNQQTINRMKENGLMDLHFALDTSFTHSKYIIRDKEEVILGTGNWNYSDVTNYRQLYIQLTDPQLAINLSRHLDKQIKTESLK